MKVSRGESRIWVWGKSRAEGARIQAQQAPRIYRCEAGYGEGQKRALNIIFPGGEYTRQM